MDFFKIYRYECSRKKLDKPITINYLSPNNENGKPKKYDTLKINGKDVVVNYSTNIQKMPNEVIEYWIETEL